MRMDTIPQTEEREVTIKVIILDIQQWARYIWSRKWILLIASVLGGVIGLFYALNKVPVYTATTTFVVESADSKGGVAGLAGMAAVAGIDLREDGGGLFQGDNILELYKSRRMLVQTLLTFISPDSNELLIERYLAYTGKKATLDQSPQLLNLDFGQDPSTLNAQGLRLRDSVMTSIANTIRSEVLSVNKPDKKLSIVEVNVTSPDEVFSKKFNENLVREVNDFYIQTKTKKSIDNIAILEAKVDSVRAVMTGAIYSAARTSDDTPNLNPTRQAQRIGPTQQAQFSAEANKAMLAQLMQNLELTKMNLIKEQPLIQIVDQPVYPLPVTKLGNLKGIIIGGFAFGFFILLFLIMQKWYRDVMTTDN